MSWYLPDTTFLIDLEREQPYARTFVQRCIENEDTLAICLITVTEYYTGCLPGERPTMDRFLETCAYWEMDQEVGLAAARHRCESKRRGIQVNLPDALIGALALSMGATVVTENPKDFTMPGVSVLSLRADT